MNRDDATRHPVEALSALLDGELDGPARRSVESHLEECEGCRGLIEDLKTLDRAVAAEPVPAPPPDLAHRIMAALPEHGANRTAVPPAVTAMRVGTWFRAPMPLAAAASLTVATLVWLAWPGGSPRIEAPGGDLPPAASIPATPPPVAGGDGVSDEAKMDAPPPPPPAPGKPGEMGSRPPAGSSARQDRRLQAPAASEAVAPERVKESAGYLDVARGDAREVDGDVGVMSKEAVDAPAATVGRGVAASAPPPNAEHQEARAREREKLAVDPERLPILGRNHQDALTLAPGVSETSARAIPMALRAEPYIVQLLPGDAMRVESDGYSCTIDLLPEDAQLLAEEYATLRQTGAATASAAGKAAAGPPSASPPAAGSSSSAPAAAAPSAAAPRPTDPGDTRPISARASAIKKEARLVSETSPEGRALILMLVRDRYRAALAERCGPPPR